MWAAPSGARLRIETERFVSFARREVAAIRVAVTPLDGAARVALRSSVDGRVANQVETGDPRVGSSLEGQVLEPFDRLASGRRLGIAQRTRRSRMALACVAVHDLRGGRLEAETPAEEVGDDPRVAAWGATVEVEAGSTVELDKTIVYVDARDGAEDALLERATRVADDAAAAGYAALREEHVADLAAFWDRADVDIEGDDATAQSLRFGMLHLRFGAGTDGRTHVAAKGLTGEGYEGHYFWDTELYMQPLFTFVRPEVARALIEFRIGTLPAARERAAELSHDGALFAWRTIDGREASAYYPAGTAQYHINAAIAYGIEQYVDATGDRSLLWDGGAELLFETARFWLSLGFVNPRFAGDAAGDFCIHGVTGPDEYTALVNDNLYTNLMAQRHLRFAARVAGELAERDPERFDAIETALDLHAAEVAAWSDAAERMRLPFDAAAGVHPQDSTFLDKEPWDFEGTPADRYPLLLHYHPLDIYRRQVLKQADVVLAMVTCGEHFSRAEARRDFDFYEALTTHDSSLSPCIHAIAAAQLGDLEAAYAYYQRTARMDLDDINRNAKDGVHTAAMGGTWLGLVAGFGGLRLDDEGVRFTPRLPKAWDGYRFRVGIRGRRLEVHVEAERVRYRLLEGAPLEFRHRGEWLRVTTDEPATRPTRPPLRGVIFDLDGVLTDTAEHHYRAWQALADGLEIAFDREANEQLRGVGRMDSLEFILNRSDRGASAWSDEEKLRLATEKNDHYQALIEGITPDDLLPGIPALLDALDGAGIAMAIGSASKNAPAVLERLGIAERFVAVVDAREVVRGKPDPEIFLRGCELLGLEPDACVGVEDAAAGVSAIDAAGIASVGVGDREHLGHATRIVPSPADLTLDVLREAFEAGRAG